MLKRLLGSISVTLISGLFVWLENDPKGTSEVTVHLTKQGRDEIIDLYSKEEKTKIKRLFKKLDSKLSIK